MRWFIVVGLLLASCSSDTDTSAEGLDVLIATDLAFPDDYDAVHISVRDEHGLEFYAQDVTEPALTEAVTADYYEITTLHFVPEDLGATFDVEAAVRKGSMELFRTRTRQRAVTGRVDLVLAASCVTLAATCQVDEACTSEGCRPADSTGLSTSP